MGLIVDEMAVREGPQLCFDNGQVLIKGRVDIGLTIMICIK